jgi:LysR family transcriptional regulator, hydrogen peroxide-inducible genes activator
MICQDQEVKLYNAYRSDSEDRIVNLVRTGMGVALMPEYTLPLSAGDVQSRYLCNPEISRQIYAIYSAQPKKGLN